MSSTPASAAPRDAAWLSSWRATLTAPDAANRAAPAMTPVTVTMRMVVMSAIPRSERFSGWLARRLVTRVSLVYEGEEGSANTAARRTVWVSTTGLTWEDPPAKTAKPTETSPTALAAEVDWPRDG